VVVVYHLQGDTEDTPPPPTVAATSTTTNKHKQANNDVTNYTQTLPEDTTSTVPSLADKHTTAPSYIK
jgi:phage tail protein X